MWRGFESLTVLKGLNVLLLELGGLPLFMHDAGIATIDVCGHYFWNRYPTKLRRIIIACESGRGQDYLEITDSSTKYSVRTKSRKCHTKVPRIDLIDQPKSCATG